MPLPGGPFAERPLEPMLQPMLQHGHAIRFDWGLPGASALIGEVRACVVVDVLSFSTTLSVAADAGIVVRPGALPVDDDHAPDEFPSPAGVLRAVSRDDALGDPGALSLSPASFRRAAGWARRVLLPSPNGSSISAGLAGARAQVLAGCLRNRVAVAEHLAGIVRDGGAVAVIAAGERWPDGALRPGVEDLLGAGAILATLAEMVGARHLSVEATAAVAAARHLEATGLPTALTTCASGRELIDRGAADDVRIAGELDSSSLVPHLIDGEYLPRFGQVMVRPADPADAPAVAHVFLSAWDHGLAGVRRAHDDDDVRGWVRDILLPGGRTWVAVRRDDATAGPPGEAPGGESGEVVGLLTTQDGWVEQLYLSPAVEGTGVGSTLLGIARARNPNGLQLWTFQCNTRARAFYERHGFVAVEFTDGAGNEEREPDVRYLLEPAG